MFRLCCIRRKQTAAGSRSCIFVSSSILLVNFHVWVGYTIIIKVIIQMKCPVLASANDHVILTVMFGLKIWSLGCQSVFVVVLREDNWLTNF